MTPMSKQLPFMRERDWELYRRRCDPAHGRWLQGLTIAESMALGMSLCRLAMRHDWTSPPMQRVVEVRRDRKIQGRRVMSAVLRRLDQIRDG